MNKELYNDVTRWFSANMERAESELHYDSPFHLLIAVILSAQCTDKRVNMYTPVIFNRFPEPSDLAAASFEEVYELIKSISFPNNKAKHLIGMASMLVSDFGSVVPSEPSELEKLPGVGRKTANVIASVIYGKAVIAVDTHVFRVSRRLGLSDGNTVEAVEKDLTAGFAEELRGTSSMADMSVRHESQNAQSAGLRIYAGSISSTISCCDSLFSRRFRF